MKTNLSWIIYPSILLMLGSCNSSGSKEPTNSNDTSSTQMIDRTKAMSEDMQDNIVSQAKAYEDSVFFYMNEAINNMSNAKTQAEKQTAKEEMNKLAKPFQAKLDSLKSLLPANKAKEVDDYRQQLVDKTTNKK
ncbi:MAG TPA: hypothetical protein PLP23_05670 [Panacibacter sp.]|nr:hypothetical protein [Panacibacter sp.]